MILVLILEQVVTTTTKRSSCVRLFIETGGWTREKGVEPLFMCLPGNSIYLILMLHH